MTIVGAVLLGAWGWAQDNHAMPPSESIPSISMGVAEEQADAINGPVTPVSIPEALGPATVARTTNQSSVSPPSAVPARPRLSTGLPRWLRLTRESGLWSGPDDAIEFTRLPAASTVRVLDRQGSRYRVYYAGDEELKRPGEAWLNAADAGDVEWPRFVRTRPSAVLRTAPAETAPVALVAPARTYLEILETSGRDWAHVYLSARPDTGEPLDAWIDGEDVVATPRDPSEYLEYTLTRDLLRRQAPDAWLRVPYRTQLDGSAYEAANCGPTVLWMALQRQAGALPAPGLLRTQTLRYQEIERCDDCGVYIEHLAAVAEEYGSAPVGLFDGGPGAFHRWTADEVRAQLRQGRVVVPQVMFRFLSGRERSDYWGDHYIVVTGYVGDRFIYHDPIDTRGPGASRTISAERLMKAMENSDYPYAAFAVGS
ncbi:MAG: C39 family peptidase [Chloroflexota bacterium]